MISEIFERHPTLERRTRCHTVVAIRILELVGADARIIQAMKTFLRDRNKHKLWKISTQALREQTSSSAGITEALHNSIIQNALLIDNSHVPGEATLVILFQCVLRYLTLSKRSSRQGAEEKLKKLFWSVYPDPDKLRQGLKYELVLYWKRVGDMPREVTHTARSVLDEIVRTDQWESGPILADALEDGGFNDLEMLAALRSDELFEGHWVYDLLTGEGYTDTYKVQVTEIPIKGGRTKR